jgi:hypothetical protein
MPKTTKTPKPSATKSAPETNGSGALLLEVMTLPEAAAWLRVAEDGLRADAVAGRIPARLAAGEWRFNKAALVAWLSAPERASKRPKTGAELAERLQEMDPTPSYAESPDAVEQEIANLYKLRKTMWSSEE